MTTIDKDDKLEKLPPVHPGEVLLEDFVKPFGLSQSQVARDISVSPIRISQIVNGKRAVTADTAKRLGRYFGTSAEVWLRLQAHYDTERRQYQAALTKVREVHRRVRETAGGQHSELHE